MTVNGIPGNAVTGNLGETTLKFNVGGADVYEFDYTDPNETPAE